MLLHLREPQVVFAEMLSFALKDILLAGKILVCLWVLFSFCSDFVEVLLLVLSFFPPNPLKRQTGEAAASCIL